MSEKYNDKEEVKEKEIVNAEDAEEKEDEYEKFCFLCRRPESQAGPMISLPNDIHICTDCMQKASIP